jgi:hypothetical protein
MEERGCGKGAIPIGRTLNRRQFLKLTGLPIQRGRFLRRLNDCDALERFRTFLICKCARSKTPPPLYIFKKSIIGKETKKEKNQMENQIHGKLNQVPLYN